MCPQRGQWTSSSWWTRAAPSSSETVRHCSASARHAIDETHQSSELPGDGQQQRSPSQLLTIPSSTCCLLLPPSAQKAAFFLQRVMIKSNAGYDGQPRCGRSLGAPRGTYVVINQLFLSPPAAEPRRRYGGPCQTAGRWCLGGAQLCRNCRTSCSCRQLCLGQERWQTHTPRLCPSPTGATETVRYSAHSQSNDSQEFGRK